MLDAMRIQDLVATALLVGRFNIEVISAELDVGRIVHPVNADFQSTLYRQDQRFKVAKEVTNFFLAFGIHFKNGRWDEPSDTLELFIQPAVVTIGSLAPAYYNGHLSTAVIEMLREVSEIIETA